MSKIRITVKKQPIYYGQIECQGHTHDKRQCTNRAYYQVMGDYLCGVHSAKHKDIRDLLPTDPHAQEHKRDTLVEHMASVERQATHNKQLGIKGTVICYHMAMMKPVTMKEGYLNIFPNFKHQLRSDGLGMASLSPKAMGPIVHCQPNLPPAKNLENLHQSNKTFPSEVNAQGQPTEAFYATRLAMYLDPIPHRHKETSGKKNVPLYSVWVMPDGQEVHLSYLESRQIYCHYYEQCAVQLPDFQKLWQLIADGYNLQICGYDAYQPTESLEQHYLDASRPFGHELVLYTLLTADSQTYPWRLHQTIEFDAKKLI
jgi:hypothetical protein